MTPKHILEMSNELGDLLCLLIAIYFVVSRRLRDQLPLILLISTYCVTQSLWLAVMLFRHELHLTPRQAYSLYFYIYWVLFPVQSFSMLWIIYRIYSEALRPFESLRRLGTLVFRWIAGIAVAVSLGVAIGPHMSSTDFYIAVAAQTQQFVNVLTLCMLLFVCVTLRPLGISPGSRLFGVSLGLGFMATSNMIQAAWLSTSGAQSIFAPIYMIGSLGVVFALITWNIFLWKSEPQRRTILVPTTSPYFLWNSVSEALGDAPGFVAVNGLAQDMLSEQEMEAFAEAHPDRQTIVVSPTLLRPAVATR